MRWKLFIQCLEHPLPLLLQELPQWVNINWSASSWWSSSLYCPMRNSDQITIGMTHPHLSSNIYLHLAYPVDLHFKNDCLCTLGILRIWKQYFCNIRLGSGSSPSIPAEYLFNMPLSISHLVSSLHIGPPSTLRKAPKTTKIIKLCNSLQKLSLESKRMTNWIKF